MLRWLNDGIEARGSDFSEKVIGIARANAMAAAAAQARFRQCSIYDLQAGRDSADLLVCCEVLEHPQNLQCHPDHRESGSCVRDWRLESWLQN